MRGYGKLPALHIAMSENPVLKNLVSEFVGLKASEFSNIQAKIIDILYAWAGVTGIDENARSAAGGTNIEARKVSFVEQVTGQEFRQLGSAKFVGQHASTAVQKAWDIAVINTTKNLLVQGPLLPIFPDAVYSFANDSIKLNSDFDTIISAAQDFAASHNLGYDFWVQLGYILAWNIKELRISIDEIRSKLSELAGEPIMIEIGVFELVGDDKDNVIKGTAGSDYIKGLGGNDKLYGYEGSDHLEGDEGNDLLYGGGGIDRMYGGTGNDKMYGGPERDFMYGNEGNDDIYGEEGDDLIEGGAGADNMDGGGGKNTLSYGDSKFGVKINLATGQANDGDAEGDTFKNFQNIGGSEFDDTLLGDEKDNYINGESGNDYIYGGDGNDDLFGATGEDYLYGDKGDDLFTGYEGPDHMDGGEGLDTVSYYHPYSTVGVNVNLEKGKGLGGYAHGDTYKNIENVNGSKFDDVLRGDDKDNIINGMEGDDNIWGGDGNDNIYGGPGYDRLFGEEGNDIIYLTADSDTAYGGNGKDTICYQFVSQGVKLNMATGKGSINVFHEDTFYDFENAMGSNYDDDITGDDSDNKLWGLAGNDLIRGGKGKDTISSGQGNDIIYGEEDDDYIYADEGDDIIDGGEGNDTVDYSREPKEALVINLRKKIVSGALFAKGDNLKNIENIVGTKFNDNIIGDGNDNKLFGEDGDDIIRGGKGNDYISGGKGKNQLYGGAGDDNFELGEGENKVDGGEGENFVIYQKANSSVTIDLSQKQVLKTTGEIDQLENIRHATGSSYNDKIIGDEDGNHLNGGDGDDYIDGGGFNDVITGGKGNNTLLGGDGSDTFKVVEGNNQIDGGKDSDTVDYASFLKGKYYEAAIQARLVKAAGTLVTLPFDLRFINKPVIKYGEGPVINQEGFIIDLSAQKVVKTEDLIDKVTSIENVVGTHYNDIIIGDKNDNEINGLDGNDKVFAGGGNDTLSFGYGKSTLYGGTGNDRFTFKDSSGDYRNIVMAGVANIYGDDGVDTLDLKSYPLAVQMNLSTKRISYSTAENFIVEYIENVIATDYSDEVHDSIGDDNIDSGAGDDKITLTNGSDTLNAGNGNDKIYLSGLGEKRIWGGIGSDTYIIGSQFKSLKNTIIIDFEATIYGDKIDLSSLTNIKSLADIKLASVKEQGLQFTIVSLGEGQEIALFNVNANNLSVHNFIFNTFEIDVAGQNNMSVV
jgi:Ca2+-binding RTX toxin-like protein